MVLFKKSQVKINFLIIISFIVIFLISVFSDFSLVKALWQEESVGNFTIDGDSVYIDTGKVNIIAYPHTLTPTRNSVDINITPKTYTGDADLMIASESFNYSKPYKLELYDPHIFYWNKSFLRVVGNVTEFQTTSADCDIGYEYNRYKRNVTYVEFEFQESTIYSDVFCFDNYTDYGNNTYKVEWLGQFSQSREYRDKTGVTQLKNYTYSDVTQWWLVKDYPVTANETYQIRITFDISSFGNETGKYWIALKPSDESVQQAIQNNHLYSLDPWYIGSDGYLDFVVPTPVNGTSTLNKSQEINISISNVSLKEFNWNWNGTNYSIMNDSLILFYNFDNRSSLGENDTHVVDLSGYGNNGTVEGSPVFNTNCVFGGCFTYDRVDEIIDAGTIDITGYSEITMSAWVTFPDYTKTNIAFSIMHSGSDDLRLLIEGNALSFNADDGVESSTEYPIGDANENTWIHVVGTIDSSTQRLYINGVEVDNITSGFDFAGASSGAVKVGGRTSSTLLWDGDIDEVRMYNRSLTAEEVHILYSSNLNKYDTNNWAFYINQTLNATDLLPNGTYTYYASATDTSSNSNQTEERTLIIGQVDSNNAPTTPTLNKPDNNSRYLDNPTLTFPLNWSNSTDADEDSITYVLQVWNNSDATDIMYANYTINEIANTTGDIVTFPNETNDYWWRVLASDGSANSSWSELRNISIVKTVEYALTITDPTTASPESVTSFDNISVYFDFTEDGVNKTADVTLNNITIEGVEAPVVSSGEAEVNWQFINGTSYPIAPVTVDTRALPGPLIEGDLIVVAATQDYNTADIAINTAGYTTIYQTPNAEPNAIVAYKVMGETPDTEIEIETLDAGSNDRCASVIIQVWRGVDPNVPLDVTRTVANAASGMPNSPSYTTSVDGQLVYTMGFLDDDDGAGSTAPSGFTNFTLQSCTPDGQAGTTMVASQIQASQGAIDPDIFGGSDTDAWYAITFAFNKSSTSGVSEEYAFITGKGWQANVTVPDFASGLKDLFVNATWNGNEQNATQSSAIDYGGADETPPYFTEISNQTLDNSQSLSYDINATDAVGFDSFKIDDTTNFSIVSSTGVISNITGLDVGYYQVNITINDTSNNLNSTLWGLNVTQAPPENVSEFTSNYFAINLSRDRGKLVNIAFRNETTDSWINYNISMWGQFKNSTAYYDTLNVTPSIFNFTIGNNTIVKYEIEYDDTFWTFWFNLNNDSKQLEAYRFIYVPESITLNGIGIVFNEDTPYTDFTNLTYTYNDVGGTYGGGYFDYENSPNNLRVMFSSTLNSSSSNTSTQQIFWYRNHSQTWNKQINYKRFVFVPYQDGEDLTQHNKYMKEFVTDHNLTTPELVGSNYMRSRNADGDIRDWFNEQNYANGFINSGTANKVGFWRDQWTTGSLLKQVRDTFNVTEDPFYFMRMVDLADYQINRNEGIIRNGSAFNATWNEDYPFSRIEILMYINDYANLSYYGDVALNSTNKFFELEGFYENGCHWHGDYLDVAQGFEGLFRAIDLESPRNESNYNTTREWALCLDSRYRDDDRLYYTDSDNNAVPDYWLRGLSWYIESHIGIYDTWTNTTEDTDKALSRDKFKNVSHGLATYQSNEGLWHQTINDTSTYLETSGTTMNSAGLANGFQIGILNATAIDSASKGMCGIMAGDYLKADGTINHTDRIFDPHNDPFPYTQQGFVGFAKYLNIKDVVDLSSRNILYTNFNEGALVCGTGKIQDSLGNSIIVNNKTVIRYYNNGSSSSKNITLYGLGDLNLTLEGLATSTSFNVTTLDIITLQQSSQTISSNSSGHLIIPLELTGKNNITIKVSGEVDSCSPSSPLTSNHQFECSDNCVISSSIDAGGYNVTVNGTGTFTVEADISNWVSRSFYGQDSSNKCEIRFYGGGFV